MGGGKVLGEGIYTGRGDFFLGGERRWNLRSRGIVLGGGSWGGRRFDLGGGNLYWKWENYCGGGGFGLQRLFMVRG